MRSEWRRYAAPAAFLLAVTIAVLLIRSGINHGKPKTPPAATPVTTQSVTTTPSKPAKKKKKSASTRRSYRRYYTVQAGDTFSVISSKTGVPAATIARLNPKASSTSLFIGEKIRIR